MIPQVTIIGKAVDNLATFPTKVGGTRARFKLAFGNTWEDEIFCEIIQTTSVKYLSEYYATGCTLVATGKLVSYTLESGGKKRTYHKVTETEVRPADPFLSDSFSPRVVVDGMALSEPTPCKNGEGKYFSIGYSTYNFAMKKVDYFSIFCLTNKATTFKKGDKVTVIGTLGNMDKTTALFMCDTFF
jgi:hypothetical protein